MGNAVLESLFPTPEAIPEAFRPERAETGLTLLIDGRLSRWDGPRAAIRSAVCTRGADGALAPVDLGPACLASAAEGREAARAAAKAWAGGRGEWPRASAEFRIACV